MGDMAWGQPGTLPHTQFTSFGFYISSYHPGQHSAVHPCSLGVRKQGRAISLVLEDTGS